MEDIEKAKEREKISTRTISGKEMVELVYKGESFPQDTRFVSPEKGGKFKYFNVSDLIQHRIRPGEYYISLVEKGDEVVGISQLQKSIYEDDVLWIELLSVAEEEQGKGYASTLVDEVFKFAKENNYSLESSSYSDDGWQKLKTKFNELAKKYNVDFRDSEKRI